MTEPNQQNKKKKHVEQCQCKKGCRSSPLPGDCFCAFHRKNGCDRTSPLSGYEPPYEPLRWNDRRNIRETHNCFAYAMNIHDPKQIEDCNRSENCNVPFHQPGYASGHNGFSSTRLKTCTDMIGRILGDNPSMRMTTFTGKCPPTTSKIAIVVDPDQDYHFYRQDKTTMWSHKPGGTKVTNQDASKRPIYDPALANRDYTDNNGHLDYDTFCSYLCVPRQRALHLKASGGGSYKVTRVRRRGQYRATRVSRAVVRGLRSTRRRTD